MNIPKGKRNPKQSFDYHTRDFLSCFSHEDTLSFDLLPVSGFSERATHSLLHLMEGRRWMMIPTCYIRSFVDNL